MFSRRWAIVWAAASSMVVLVAGACIPIWEREECYRAVIYTENVPAWRWLTDRRGWLADDELWSPFDPDRVQAANRITCVKLVVVAGIAGLLAYLVRRPRARPLETVDYVDGPDLAARDGRAG